MGPTTLDETKVTWLDRRHLRITYGARNGGPAYCEQQVGEVSITCTALLRQRAHVKQSAVAFGNLIEGENWGSRKVASPQERLCQSPCPMSHALADHNL